MSIISTAMRHCIAAGMAPDAVIAMAADMASAMERPKVSQSSKRLGSAWRKQAFAILVDRDGAICAECSTPDRIIWRRNGVFANGQWGDEPWEAWRYTKVLRSSNLEVDHRTPLSHGGDNAIENLWLLCIECHKRKTSAERSGRLKALFAEARR